MQINNRIMSFIVLTDLPDVLLELILESLINNIHGDFDMSHFHYLKNSKIFKTKLTKSEKNTLRFYKQMQTLMVCSSVNKLFKKLTYNVISRTITTSPLYEYIQDYSYSCIRTYQTRHFNSFHTNMEIIMKMVKSIRHQEVRMSVEKFKEKVKDFELKDAVHSFSKTVNKLQDYLDIKDDISEKSNKYPIICCGRNKNGTRCANHGIIPLSYATTITKGKYIVLFCSNHNPIPAKIRKINNRIIHKINPIKPPTFVYKSTMPSNIMSIKSR